MPTLHYSNYLEELVKPLVFNMQNEDLFSPKTLIVPNYNLQKWLSLEIARTQGIVANIHFKNLEKTIEEACLAVEQVPPLKVLSQEQFQGMLVKVLKEKSLTGDQREWRHLKAYIESDDTISEEVLDVRIFQLAKRIQILFRNYAYHRPDLLKQWKTGNFCFAKTLMSETERWQQYLWLELFGESGFLSQRNQTILDLPLLSSDEALLFTLDELSEQFTPSPLPHKTALHVFGISYISLFHRNALSKLDEQYDVYVYTLNPCMQFWEDLRADWEVRRDLRKKLLVYKDDSISQEEFEVGELVQNESDNSLLRAWGRPGREYIRLLNELAGWKFEEHFINPCSSTKPWLLHQVQYDILTREPQRTPSLGMPLDESIRLFACPSLKRECEIVVNEIWQLLQNDPNLHLNEIGIIVPSMENYQTDLEISLQRLHQLPYNLLDGMASSAGRTREGILKLLKLGFSEYNRKEVFEILAHPNFIAKFGEDTINIDQWLEWTEELGIFYGIDQNHQIEKGFKHLSKNLYNWKQGLHRITLGMYLQPSQTQVADTYHLEGESYLPLSLEESDFEEARHFYSIVSSLLEDTRYMPEWNLSAQEWGDYLKILINTYFAPANAFEQSEFQAILNEIANLKSLDQINDFPEATWNYRTFYSFVEQQLSNISTKRGHYLADGVTIASFLPMRPIPFKTLFIMGLGEGEFPKPYKKDNLDLREAPIPLKTTILGKRLKERNIGDVSNAEKDKYMFLESLISTRQYFYMSYVARDEQSDETLEPSSVVQVLTEVIETQYLLEGQAFTPIVHPLKNYSLQYFPELQTGQLSKPTLTSIDEDAFQQARALQLRKDLNQHLQAALKEPPIPSRALLKTLFDRQQTSEAPLPSTFSVDEEPSNDKPKIALSFHQLRNFLECPLQATAKRKLGIREEDDTDLKEMVTEPFETDFLQENLLLKSVFSHAVTHRDSHWDTLYDRQVELFELSSLSPSGKFKDWNRNRHLALLEEWKKNLILIFKQDQWKAIAEKLHLYRFGSGVEGEPSNDTFPRINLDITLKSGNVVSIELQGAAHWIYEESPQSSHSVYLSNYQKTLAEKHLLRAFLDMVFLSASGIKDPNNPYQGHLIAAKYGEIQSQKIKFWNQQKSLNYLRSLIRTMLEDEFHYLFPIEVIFTVCKRQIPPTAEEFNMATQEEVQKLLSNPLASFSSRYGPIRDLESYGPPQDAYSIFFQRHLPFLKAMEPSTE